MRIYCWVTCVLKSVCVQEVGGIAIGAAVAYVTLVPLKFANRINLQNTIGRDPKKRQIWICSFNMFWKKLVPLLLFFFC